VFRKVQCTRSWFIGHGHGSRGSRVRCSISYNDGSLMVADPRVQLESAGKIPVFHSACVVQAKNTRSSAVTERPRDVRVIEYFAKSLKITQGRSKWLSSSNYRCVPIVPFLRYSALNNSVTLKSGVEVTRRCWKRYYSKALVRFLIRIQ